MTREEANARLAAIMDEVRELQIEGVKIARQHSLAFGTGATRGTFIPDEQALADYFGYESVDDMEEDGYNTDEYVGRWVTSSDFC